MKTKGLKYLNIYQEIRSNILMNRYNETNKFPTENQIMTEYSISRTTARNALKLLKEEGLIESKPGHGTDVLSTFKTINYGQSMRQTSIRDINFCFIPNPVESIKHSEILVDLISATADIASALEVPEGTSVYRIRWLHFVNEKPYLYLHNYLRPDMVPALPDHVKGVVSLYPMLEKEYGLYFERGVESIKPTVADFITARLLEVPINTPLLMLRRCAYCSKGPLEYSVSIIRPDLMEIRMTMALNS